MSGEDGFAQMVAPGQDDLSKEELKDEAGIWLEARVEEWLQDLRTHKQTGSTLTLYRCMTVEDPQKFLKYLQKGKFLAGYDGLGIFWSWLRGAAECHWGKSTGHEITLVSEVTMSNIDLKRTILANTHVQLHEEKEITLKSGAIIKLLGLHGYDFLNRNDFGFQLEKPLKSKASIQ